MSASRVLAWLLVAVAVLGFLGAVALLAIFFRKPPLETVGWGRALAVDGLLLLAFALQHSGMAHPRWRAWIRARLPAFLERPLYAAVASLAFAGLLAAWQHPPGVLFDLRGTVGEGILHALTGVAGVFVLLALAETGSADLMGVTHARRGLGLEEIPLRPLRTDGLYAVFRHPLLVGTILVLWTWPVVTTGRALLAGGMTLYIAWAVPREERTLRALYGQTYVDYCARVPRWLPRLR